MATASASPASHVADWSDGWLVVLVSSGAHDGPPTPLQRQCQAAIAKYEAARLTGRGLELARRRLREVGGLVQQVAEVERQQTREMRAAERAAEERDRCAACRERHERMLQLLRAELELYDAMKACGCTAGRA